MIKADLIITDPPYNVNYSSKNEFLNKSDKGTRIQTPIKNDFYKENEKFIDFLTAAFANYTEAIKDGGAIYIFHAQLKYSLFEEALKNVNIKIKQILTWVKNNFVLGLNDYQWITEGIIYTWKEGAKHYFIDDRSQKTVFEDRPNINKMSKDELKSYLKSILDQQTPVTAIYEDKPQINDLHPTMKPIKLIAKLIKNSSKQGETIIDFFGGSGSTLIACEQTNRKCRMMELDEKYCDVIIKRWETLTGRKAELISEK